VELTPLAIGGLFVVALLAGIVDAIAGGGGLLTVPALLSTSLPTTFVFGTNKGSAVFGSGASLWRFWRANLVDRKRAPLLFPVAFAGSLCGALAVTWMDPKQLRPVVLVLLVLAGLIVAFARPPEASPGQVAANATLKGALLALIIGSYDGFFGPGTGTFLIIGFVWLLHLTPQEASANAKVVNFASNLAAMLLFAFKGLIVWRVSLPMAAGQFIGGVIGAHLAVKQGDALVKKMVLVVVVLLVMKLASDLLNA